VSASSNRGYADAAESAGAAGGLALSVVALVALVVARASVAGDYRFLLCLAAGVFGLGGAVTSTAAGLGCGFGGRRVRIGITLGVLVFAAAAVVYAQTFNVLVDQGD
jgi:hypothetical protein